jgi:hypothetical protein
MSPEQISSIAAILLSLAFAYVPGIKDWYSAREATQKAGIMALLLIAVAVGAFALACGQILTGVSCDKSGAIALASNLIAALVANQSAYVLLVRPFKPKTDVEVHALPLSHG